MPLFNLRRMYFPIAVFLAVLLISIENQSHAGFFSTDAVYQTSDGAIKGYDPVAYFTRGKPTKGKSHIRLEYKGATWHFASTSHLESFKANPDKYVPAYGGYCAYALSEGYTASIDPSAWAIENGRLFLNYSLGVKQQWDANRAQRILQGDKNWPTTNEGKAYLSAN